MVFIISPILYYLFSVIYYAAVFMVVFSAIRFNSKYFSRILFSRVYKYIITPILKRHSDELRAKLLADLTRLQAINPSKPLKILEVGPALGLNFEFYPPNSHVTALDINPFFERYYKENRTKFSNVTLDKFIVGNAENMKEIRDHSFDAVVATYLLCSVEFPEKALAEIRRVLKEGGTYFFLEHPRYPSRTARETMIQILQRVVEPFWYTLLEGCHLCRRQDRWIRNAGFAAINYNYEFPPKMFLLTRAQFWGTAVTHVKTDGLPVVSIESTAERIHG